MDDESGKERERERGGGELELGGYLLEDLVKVHPHSRVSGLWIRRPVTPALSDQPHCFNLPPKRSFPLFSSLLFLLLFFFFSPLLLYPPPPQSRGAHRPCFLRPSFLRCRITGSLRWPVSNTTSNPRPPNSSSLVVVVWRNSARASPLRIREKIRSTLRRFLARNIGGEQRYEPPRRLPRRD